MSDKNSPSPEGINTKKIDHKPFINIFLFLILFILIEGIIFKFPDKFINYLDKKGILPKFETTHSVNFNTPIKLNSPENLGPYKNLNPCGANSETCDFFNK